MAIGGDKLLAAFFSRMHVSPTSRLPSCPSPPRWFLTAYFGLATILSLRAVLARRRGGAQPAAGPLARALVVMFHVESPVRSSSLEVI